MPLNIGLLFGQLPGALAQGLIWGIMAIGVYITFRILDIPDLTVDGSFCTGAAVAVMLIMDGYSIWVALIFAFLAGAAAGFFTGAFHVFFGISPILAGILTQLGLWTVNLMIMGRPNQSLPVAKYNLLVSLRYIQEVANGEREFYWHPIFIVGLFIVVLIAGLYWFFGTELGSSLRATGANQSMAKAQGINTGYNKILGLMLSNGMVALSGALLAQYQGFADINMGRGAIIIGLAAVIIGEVIFSRVFRNFALKLFSAVLGSGIYYVVIQTVLWMKLDANYLKLLTAIVVAVFLAVPYWKERIIIFPKGKKGGGGSA